MAQNTHGITVPSTARWILPGLIAGLVFAMWAMMVGIFTPGSNFLAPPQGIAQSVGIGVPGHDFQILPFVAGLMGHMMNSVVLGAIFIVVAGAIHLRGRGAILAGMMYGVVVYIGMYWILLRGLLAGSSQSFLTANPEWSWIVGHLMFGVILGGLVAYGPLRHPVPEPSGQRVVA